MPQSLKLLITAGSRPVFSGSTVRLSSPSRSLHFQNETIPIEEEIAAFESRSFLVSLKSNFCDEWTSKGQLHEVTASAMWTDSLEESINKAESVQTRVKLHFIPPFLVSHKVLTCDRAKFCQVRQVLAFKCSIY